MGGSQVLRVCVNMVAWATICYPCRDRQGAVSADSPDRSLTVAARNRFDKPRNRMTQTLFSECTVALHVQWVFARISYHSHPMPPQYIALHILRRTMRTRRFAFRRCFTRRADSYWSCGVGSSAVPGGGRH